MNHMHVALSGIGLRGYPTGLSEPDVVISLLMELYRQGRFPVGRLVTKYPFAKIEDAVQAAAHGAFDQAGAHLRLTPAETPMDI